MATLWQWLAAGLLLATSAGAVSANGTAATYDPAELLEKIFRPNMTLESRERGYGLVRFEADPGQYGHVDTERDQTPLRFDDDYVQNYNTNIGNNNQGKKPVKFEDSDDYLTSHNNGVSFQDDNNVNDEGNKKKRKRKRRRKPKNGALPYQGRPDIDGARPGPAGYLPGAAGYLPGAAGYLQDPQQAGYGLYEPAGAPVPGYTGVRPLRRPRRPRARPSLATEALASITGALTSIALYDDYQCVPRLLCEAAGGGALPGQGALQSIAGIQPLLTLLSTYNGMSSSPLFVFGRAVLLGMTSPGSPAPAPAPCRYAYPLCPTDPEQLIHYLNNHNGGFFRFFNAPQQHNQNLEQFYNQLANQGYGLYQPQPNPAYGYPNDPSSGQHYGLYSSNQNPGQYYGQKEGFQRPRPSSLYDNQNYGSNYAYDYGNYGSGNQIRFKDRDVKIQKRIQNKPSQNLADYEVNSFENDEAKTKWQFPDEQTENVNVYNVRGIRKLKFPEEGQSNNDEKEVTRKGKQVHFSNNKYHQYDYNNQQHVIPSGNRLQTSTFSYNNGQNQHNYYTTNRAILSNTYNNNYQQPSKYHNYDYNPSNYNENVYQKYQNYQNPSNHANHYQQNYYNNKQNMYGNNQKYQPNTVFNNEEYVFDHKHNFYVKKENNYSSSASKYNTNNYYNNGNNYYNANNNLKRNEEEGVNTVYIVRGNGDPSRPEVVQLRPGQTVH